MARVNSGSVAPSYPRAQNTSSARSSASSASNCRVRPEGMTLSRGNNVSFVRGVPAPGDFIVPNGTDNSPREAAMSGKLKGKVAVVTGASKGIGAGIARPLAAVVVNYSSSKAAADKVVADIRGAGRGRRAGRRVEGRRREVAVRRGGRGV